MIEYTIKIHEKDGVVRIHADTKKDQVTESEMEGSTKLAQAIRVGLASVALSQKVVTMREEGSTHVADLVNATRQAIGKAEEVAQQQPTPIAKPTIKEDWERYYAMCFPDGTPEDQRIEMEAAFYGAYFAALITVTKAAEGTEEQGCAILDALMNEARAFYRKKNQTS